MDTLTSAGICLYCDTEFSRSAISRHLGSHLAKKAKEMNAGTSFHLKVENDTRGGHSALYFLNLWVDGEVLMGDIDSYLRAIWLECCGHMSSFTIAGQKKRSSMFDIDNMDDENELMETETADILVKGMKLEYQYDFGSTTKLVVTVMEKYNVEVPEDIILLSRNEPLAIMCDLCGTEPAKIVCTVCYDESMFCKKCSKKHAKTCDDFAEYSSIPVVNSPRMGVCGYDGGRIDKKRDGVFVKK